MHALNLQLTTSLSKANCTEFKENQLFSTFGVFFHNTSVISVLVLYGLISKEIKHFLFPGTGSRQTISKMLKLPTNTGSTMMAKS